MRKVVVLAEAAEDIEQARDFYDAQESGAGGYCADSLLADIESLALYHGIHPGNLVFIECWLTDFRLEFITAKRRRRRRLWQYWICAAIRIGSAPNFRGAIKIVRLSVFLQQFSHIHRFHSG